MGVIARRCLSAIVFALSLTTAASAQKPNGFVTFTVDKIVTEPAGTWVATGAIDDQGTCCVDAPHFLRGVSGFVRIIDELTGQNGTITWQSEVMFNGRALGNHVVALEGSWHVIGGTGAYAGVTGHGKVGGTFNQATEEMHAVNTGVISLAPGALEFRTIKQ